MVKKILVSSRQMKLRRVCLRFFFRLALFAAVTGSVIGGFYHDKWRVREIAVSGAEVLESGEVADIVRGLLARRVAYILPGDNIVLLDAGNLTEELRRRLSRIKDVTVRRESFDKLSVNITERKTWGIYCREENCFLLDVDGFVFAPSPAFEGNLIVKVIDRRERDTVSLGETVFTGKFSLSELKSVLEDATNKRVLEITIDSANEWSVTTSAGWRILLDERIDLESAIQNLRAALGEIGEASARLDYIDLRYGRKIFYKFK